MVTANAFRVCREGKCYTLFRISALVFVELANWRRGSGPPLFSIQASQRWFVYTGSQTCTCTAYLCQAPIFAQSRASPLQPPISPIADDLDHPAARPAIFSNVAQPPCSTPQSPPERSLGARGIFFFRCRSQQTALFSCMVALTRLVFGLRNGLGGGSGSTLHGERSPPTRWRASVHGCKRQVARK